MPVHRAGLAVREIDYLSCAHSLPAPDAILPPALTQWNPHVFLFLIPDLLSCLAHAELKASASLNLYCVSSIHKNNKF